MRTLVKWLGIGTGGIAALLVLAVATVYAVSSYKLGKRHDVSPQELAVMPDSSSIAHGARLARVLGCNGCHGPDLEGRIMFNQRFMARVVAPNLTEVRGVYSDLDFVRMLRHGVRPNGRSAIPAMPSPSYTYLTDEDLAAIIAYVRSVPPTGGGDLPSTRLGLLVRFALVTGALSLPADIIDHSRPPQATVDREDLEGFGWYLSHAICTECHGSDLRGSSGFLTTPNLAISMAYTGEQFREFLRTGIALGGRELQGMSPLARDRYAGFTDHEIDALHAYLKTLAATADVAVRGATVVDVASGLLVPDQTVLIAGNRIVAVGPSDEVVIAPGADVIDAAGGYLIPGLWDMHVHSVRSPAAVGEEGSIDNVEWHFPLYLAYGVTGVRNMNDATADPTLELTNSVRRRLADGELLGPRLLASGPFVDGDPPLGERAVVVRTAAEARAVVDRLADAGADFIKPYENLSREAFFAIMDQARRRGIPVDGHVPFRVTPAEAAAAGQRTVEHPEVMAAGCSTDAEAVRDRFARTFSDDYDNLPENEQFLVQFRLYRAFYDTRDPAACEAAIEAFRRHGVAVTVDVVAYHHIVRAEEILADTTSMRLVPHAVRRDWEERAVGETFREFQSILRPIIPLELENVRLLHEAGVTLLAATDVGVPLQVPGISLHRELVRLTEAGLTPLEALRAATLNPARVLGLADSLGTIEPGKLADLVLLDANPLADIRNTQRIRAVIADGRVYRRADLDRLLAEAEAPESTDREPRANSK